MFWMRLFGARRQISRNSFDELGFGDEYEPKSKGPRKSISYVPRDLYEGELAPLDGPLSQRRRSSSRRSAIDLNRQDASVEFGCGTGLRLSVDSACSARQYLGSLLTTYTDFMTKHKGKHSKIMRATNRQTGSKVILKVFDKNHMSATQRDDVSKELRMLRKAKGFDGVAQLEGSYEDENFVSFIMKEIPNGTLLSRTALEGGRIPEDVCVREVVLPLVQTISWLHEHNIVHRNLKPEHILFDAHGALKVVDFMSSATLGKDSMISREGTLAYMAPEMLSKPAPEEIFHDVICNGIDEADLPSYDEKVDVWSIGVTIVECLTGRQPFLADNPETMLRVQKQELQGNGQIGVWDFLNDREILSMEGRDFLSRIFTVNPDERPSSADLLQHPWLELLSPTGVVDYHN
ncbi:hypothetical protein BSKO_06992 [Bryopsis sp. KO-2023]|nr:hypothetical protein BSKO_06992 [Bryopsis sp. KO-2023]